MAQKVRILCDEVDENNNYILRAGEIGILREPDTYTETEKQELAQFPGQDMRLVYVPRLNTSELFAMDELALVTEQESVSAGRAKYQIGDVVELLQDSANMFVEDPDDMEFMIEKANGEWQDEDDDEDEADDDEYQRRALKGYHAVVYWEDTFADQLCVRLLENGHCGFLEKAIVRYVSTIKFSVRQELPATGGKVRACWGKTDRFDRVIYPPGSVGMVIDRPVDWGVCKVLVAEGEEVTDIFGEYEETYQYDWEPIAEEEYKRLAKPRLQVGDTVRVKDEPEKYLLAVKKGQAASYDGPRKGDTGVIVEAKNRYPFNFVLELDRFKERYASDKYAHHELAVPGYLLEKTGHTEAAEKTVIPKETKQISPQKAAANPGCLLMVAMLLFMALGMLL